MIDSLLARKIALYADIWIAWAQTLRSQTLLTDAVSGRVTIRATLDPWLDTNRQVLVGFFQVTQHISDEHREMLTEPDPAPSEFEILAQRLCEMVQQPVPGNSDMIDIEQILKQLLPVDTEVEETEQPTLKTEEVDDRPSGNVA